MRRFVCAEQSRCSFPTAQPVTLCTRSNTPPSPAFLLPRSSLQWRVRSLASIVNGIQPHPGLMELVHAKVEKVLARAHGCFAQASSTSATSQDALGAETVKAFLDAAVAAARGAWGASEKSVNNGRLLSHDHADGAQRQGGRDIRHQGGHATGL